MDTLSLAPKRTEGTGSKIVTPSPESRRQWAGHRPDVGCSGGWRQRMGRGVWLISPGAPSPVSAHDLVSPDRVPWQPPFHQVREDLNLALWTAGAGLENWV